MTPSRKLLQCDMYLTCKEPVTHVDNKGFGYCAKHAEQRRAVFPCRKLRPWETRKLEQGGVVRY